MRTISAGRSLPRISAMTFADSTSLSVRGLSSRCILTLSPDAIKRCTSIASSAVSAAAGIFFTLPSYFKAPVCGVRNESDATERMMTAIAPYVDA